ncbi:hypothetical protein VKT23_019169 [Stygiomarasmius scandens]|uniref:Uncharacterized protein n=1 Tax=Marasmiellus scandens TaxID=2682957 RepID=A0ABR1IQK9_9AGAR
MTLTLADLTKNKDSNRPISFTDGLAGSIHFRTHEFVTSPNCTVLPRPPFGSTRDLYRRADARYGEDDPLQWPQPYNHNYQYLTCIPSSPNTPDDPYYEDSCLWRTVSESEMQFSAQGQMHKIGMLHPWIIAPFSTSVDQLCLCATKIRDRFENNESVVQLLNEFEMTTTICMNRLSTVSSTFHDTL